jgi:hypothetical protein
MTNVITHYPTSLAHVASAMAHRGKWCVISPAADFRHRPASSWDPARSERALLLLEKALNAWACLPEPAQVGACMSSGIIAFKEARSGTSSSGRVMTAWDDHAQWLGSGVVGSGIRDPAWARDCPSERVYEAKSAGEAVLTWSHLGGEIADKEGRTALGASVGASETGWQPEARLSTVGPRTDYSRRDALHKAWNREHVWTKALAERARQVMGTGADNCPVTSRGGARSADTNAPCAGRNGARDGGRFGPTMSRCASAGNGRCPSGGTSRGQVSGRGGFDSALRKSADANRGGICRDGGSDGDAGRGGTPPPSGKHGDAPGPSDRRRKGTPSAPPRDQSRPCLPAAMLLGCLVVLLHLTYIRQMSAETLAGIFRELLILYVVTQTRLTGKMAATFLRALSRVPDRIRSLACKRAGTFGR